METTEKPKNYPPKKNYSAEVNPQGGARNNHYPRKDKKHAAPKPVEMLPDPTILESYDYVVEGAAAQILAMFEAEQRHRHNWETEALKTYKISSITGQVLGFLIAVAIFGSAATIGLYGNSATAGFVWVFGMSIVMMSGLVWTYAKSMGQRPLFGRPTFRRNFRAEPEGEAEER